MFIGRKIFIYNCTKSDKARDEGLTTPEDVERFDNLLYGKDEKWQILDVYKPKNISGKLPVIVSIHGGGWVYGTKETYQFYCMSLAQRGFAVINSNYRLAPKCKHPGAIEDTNLVFEWLLANADKYGFDTDNIFAVGDSAGAQNIALYACILTNKEYAGKYSFTCPKELKIKGLGLNCGVYDAEHGPKNKVNLDFLPHHGNSEERKLVSPVNFINGDFPPSFILTGNMDYLKDDSKTLANILELNGIKYVFKEYGSNEELLYHVFHCNIKTEAAKKANDDQSSFFRALIE